MTENATVTERRDVIVVGGGQAGLAIGYLVGRQGLRLAILDAAQAPAAAWRSRWDSLRLFTPVRYDSLPGRAFPGHPDTYPGRDDVVAYLTDYARDFELPVELTSAVRAVRPGDGGYLVELDDRSYEADQVVIATGPFQIRACPTWLAALPPTSCSSTAPSTADRRTCRRARCSSSAAGTPAFRSPRSCRIPTRYTSRSARDRHPSPSASSGATCSATWKPPA